MRSRFMGRIAAIMAALAVVGGCARAATFDRPADHIFSSGAGPAPTAHSIADALYRDAYGLDIQECPFFLARCIQANRNMRLLHVRLVADEVQCSPVAQWTDRCSFRLTETEGREVVRSRCTGYFGIVGTSHDPFRWGVDYGDYSRPAIICRSGRTERRAVA